MSFNKRYFSRDGILARYERGGIDAVISSFVKIDGAVFEDSFSSQIGDAVYERDTELLTKLIQDELSRQNISATS